MLQRITAGASREMEPNDYQGCSKILSLTRDIHTNTLLLRFVGRSMLLVRSLLSGGANGARRALWVFQRQRRSDPDLNLHTLLDTLCQEEVWPDNDSQPLTAKPLVCLFPEAFQLNLLSFIHLIYPVLPCTSVLRLIDCLMHETTPNPWIISLARQLCRDLGVPEKEPLFTPQCGERLSKLSEYLGGGTGHPTGWTSYFCSPAEPEMPPGEPDLLCTLQRKRKSSFVDVNPDSEGEEQQRKRPKMDLHSSEAICSSEDPTAHTDGLSGRVDGITATANVEAQLKALVDCPYEPLPEHVKASITQIKELLESKMEWDQNSVDVFKVMNECDPTQVEVVCGMLRLSEVPEQTLPQLCSALLACSTDLSYSTASTLIKHLLLGKVLSLSEPASRCLVSTVKSLCSRYPRPTCHALIGPVLEEGQIGNAQAELLNRLIEDCFEPHYRLLVFEMTLREVWSEDLITVIHCLLDSKLGLNEELFAHFTEQLNNQAHRFTKSIKFAKMMLTVLTKYYTHVTSSQKQTLSCSLSSNETFLKKSIQAALKKVTHT